MEPHIGERIKATLAELQVFIDALVQADLAAERGDDPGAAQATQSALLVIRSATRLAELYQELVGEEIRNLRASRTRE